MWGVSGVCTDHGVFVNIEDMLRRRVEADEEEKEEDVEVMNPCGLFGNVVMKGREEKMTPP